MLYCEMSLLPFPFFPFHNKVFTITDLVSLKFSKKCNVILIHGADILIVAFSFFFFHSQSSTFYLETLPKECYHNLSEGYTGDGI